MVNDPRVDSEGTMSAELYTVDRYYPESETCDLFPASNRQRGALKDVPIQWPFVGRWEVSANHQPQVGLISDPGQWGNASRGPAWGMRFPVEAGDMAIVQYLNGSQSDPYVSGFVNWRQGFGVAWSANQVLSQQNDYTTQTPEDDDLIPNRFDLLLPSGAWLRSTASGSWTIATAPVDRARAFFTMHGDGNIRIKARAAEDYTVHLEFDPSQNYGRICLGGLEDGSFIEFKDGDITLKGKRIVMQGEEVRGDIRPQSVGGAMDALTTQSSAQISDTELPGLVSAAAGEMVAQGMGASSPVPPGVVALQTTPTPSYSDALRVLSQFPPQEMIISNLMSNPAIDGALRGRIEDVLQNPQGLVSRALEQFQSLVPSDLMAGDRLGQLLGANALAGGLGGLTSRLDLTSLPMIQELGIPSWVGEGIKGAIAGGGITSVLQVLPNMTDNQLLAEACRYLGTVAMGGSNADVVRGLVPDLLELADEQAGLGDRLEGLLTGIDRIPLPSGNEAISTAAQRLGRHILRGNNCLGGGMNFFDMGQLEGLALPGDTLGRVRRVARQIEDFAANPHQLVDSLPDNVAPHLGAIAAIPPEIRDALQRVPQDLLGRLPNLASGLLGRLEGQFWNSNNPPSEDEPGCAQFLESAFENLTSSLPDWLPEERELGALIQTAPLVIQQAIADLPSELLQGMAGLDLGTFQGLLQNPGAILEGLDTGMIRNLFGGMTSPDTGTFNMRVMRRATFSIMPQGSQPLADLGNTVFHRDTVATPITRVVEYGALNLPDLWSRGGL